MSAYIIPVLFLIVLAASFIRRREPYGGFIDGARQAVDLALGRVGVPCERARAGARRGGIAKGARRARILASRVGCGLARDTRRHLYDVRCGQLYRAVCVRHLRLERDGVLYFHHILFAVARAAIAVRHSRRARRNVHRLYRRLLFIEIFLARFGLKFFLRDY